MYHLWILEEEIKTKIQKPIFAAQPITLLVPKGFYIFIILVYHIYCLNRTQTK